MPRASTTLFEDAIDVPLWLEADRLTPYAERVRRDRDIGRRISQRDRVQRVRSWWLYAAPDAGSGAGARLERLRTLVAVAMAAVGGVTGVAVALAAFAYDGSQPVNVVRLLALLVGVQLVLLALTLVLLPGRVPGLRRIQDLVAALNPGAWAAGVFRKLAHASPDVARLFDRHAARAAYRRFAKWQLLYWSQTAAVAFNVAALVAASCSSRSRILPSAGARRSTPTPRPSRESCKRSRGRGHALAPGAVPSAALIEQSQFFRLDASTVAAASPRALGAWWPFIVAALMTYGLTAAARVARAHGCTRCARRPRRCCSRTAK